MPHEQQAKRKEECRGRGQRVVLDRSYAMIQACEEQGESWDKFAVYVAVPTPFRESRPRLTAWSRDFYPKRRWPDQSKPRLPFGRTWRLLQKQTIGRQDYPHDSVTTCAFVLQDRRFSNLTVYPFDPGVASNLPAANLMT